MTNEELIKNLVNQLSTNDDLNREYKTALKLMGSSKLLNEGFVDIVIETLKPQIENFTSEDLNRFAASKEFEMAARKFIGLLAYAYLCGKLSFHNENINKRAIWETN